MAPPPPVGVDGLRSGSCGTSFASGIGPIGLGGGFHGSRPDLFEHQLGFFRRRLHGLRGRGRDRGKRRNVDLRRLDFRQFDLRRLDHSGRRRLRCPRDRSGRRRWPQLSRRLRLRSGMHAAHIQLMRYFAVVGILLRQLEHFRRVNFHRLPDVRDGRRSIVIQNRVRQYHPQDDNDYVEGDRASRSRRDAARRDRLMPREQVQIGFVGL